MRKKHRMLRVTFVTKKWWKWVKVVIQLVQIGDSLIKASRDVTNLMFNFYRWICDVLQTFM